MDSEIIVSVLITVYNNAEYIDECLESVVNQKCGFGFEIIIGDDGSDDGTLEKAEEWRRKYPDMISVYVMEREQGKKYLGPVRASKNRLNILKHVRGKYFAYLDGDDYYCSENKLRMQVEFLEEHPECAACGHSINILDKAAGKSTISPSHSEPFIKDLKHYWFNEYMSTDTLLFRSSCIDTVRSNADFLENSFNDNVITFTMLQNGSVYYHPETMAVYRWTGNGIWTASNEKINNIRDIMVFETEMRINKKLRTVSCLRHYPGIKYFMTYKKPEAETGNKETMELWKQVIADDGLRLSSACCGIFEGKSPPLPLRWYYICGSVYWGIYYSKFFGGIFAAVLRGARFLKRNIKKIFGKK